MTVLVHGTGLIGSSIIRIIKRAHPNVKILGSDENPASLQYLLQKHLINQKVDFTTASSQADVIILAGPVNVIVNDLKTLAHQPALKPNVLVTDVGSSKQLIMKAAKPLMAKGVHFLGGHPFAGSHLSGSQNSSLDLFAEHVYFLVQGNASHQDVKRFEDLLSAAQVKFRLISALQHDQLLSFMSHLPHVIAFSLINTITPQLKRMGVSPRIGAGGIRDTTWIAMSNPEMWTAIFNSNAPLITDQINRFEKQLDDYKKLIQTHQTQALMQKIWQADVVRQEMEGKQ